jgi:hypothetical protein
MLHGPISGEIHETAGGPEKTGGGGGRLRMRPGVGMDLRHAGVVRLRPANLTTQRILPKSARQIHHEARLHGQSAAEPLPGFDILAEPFGC